jgi:pantoate--beta-alanine ligase
VQIVKEIPELREQIKAARRNGLTVGAVPTMGALHEGHLSLLRRARQDNDLVVMTLFVNPTQFNDPADFEKYPRDYDRDAALAEAESVDILFQPAPEAVYPKEFDTGVVVRALSERLEGASRPGHFTGVSTVVCKLLNLITPDRAYFGQKDWQQLQLIKRMVADLNIDTEIVPMPIVREEDGLAMSSRNVRLTPEHRQSATVLSRALGYVQDIADTGVINAYELAAWLKQSIDVEKLANVDYAVVVDPDTLQEIDTIENGAIAAVAVNFGDVRLIDNRLIRSSITPAAPR